MKEINQLEIFLNKMILFGHKDVNTTMIYTHVLNCGPQGVKSPAEILKS